MFTVWALLKRERVDQSGLNQIHVIFCAVQSLIWVYIFPVTRNKHRIALSADSILRTSVSDSCQTESESVELGVSVLIVSVLELRLNCSSSSCALTWLLISFTDYSTVSFTPSPVVFFLACVLLFVFESFQHFGVKVLVLVCFKM